LVLLVCRLSHVTVKPSSVTQLLCPVPMDDITREEFNNLTPTQKITHVGKILSGFTFAKCTVCERNEMTGFGRRGSKEVPMCDPCRTVTHEPPRCCGTCPKPATRFVRKEDEQAYKNRHGPNAPLAFCASCYTARRKPPRSCGDCPEPATRFVRKEDEQAYKNHHGPNAPLALCASCYTARCELLCVECGEQATRSQRVGNRTKFFCETHHEAFLADGDLSDAETTPGDLVE
jgi:hypothetical protein